MTKKNRMVNVPYKNSVDLIKNFKGIAAFMWDTNFINTVLGAYNENINGVEDFDYNIRTFLSTNKIKFSKECLITFYRNSDCLFFKQNAAIREKSRNLSNMYLDYLKIKSKINKDTIINISNDNSPLLFANNILTVGIIHSQSIAALLKNNKVVYK
jgi:hypothetical protein